jgi:UDP-N-acetyl-D-mannosaminuronic acid dehydrogenase
MVVMQPQTVLVVGLGYIGLPTAILIAEAGFQVVGYDVNESVRDSISTGLANLVEPGVKEGLEKALESGRLRVTSSLEPADVFIICVPTPLQDNGSFPEPDVSAVLTAARDVAQWIKDGDSLIIESTCPVGTTELVKADLQKRGIDTEKLSIAYCPERVIPGRIMEEMTSNDRIVGGVDSHSTTKVAAFYELFVEGFIAHTNARTAEICKLAENTYRDVNIAFANELSMICAEKNIDVWQVIKLANLHPRVEILKPGAGVGGHCIAVDPWFLAALSPSNSRLIQTARKVNDEKTSWVLEQIEKRAREIGSSRIICYGLSYKPNVDDLRESPALEIALKLVSKGFNVTAVEPNIKEHSFLNLQSIDEIDYENSLLVILVKHREFLAQSVKANFRDTCTLDFCGLL